ncbi:hypothetical protein F5887DRAFT_986203 [Amanita rubescens]|nr:hypothetical protein F5887DRAFT_995290 [Amanita rubescens]KAF8336720.1 hypothetical protein F5887DRAFT_986203 [Amanita rubescens]
MWPDSSSRLSKKPILFICTFLITFLILFFWYKNTILTSCPTALAIDDHFKPVSSIGPDFRLQKHKRIAIASDIGHHHDVYLALAWTLERVMKGRGQLDVYARTPLSFGFGKVVQQLGLYHGVIRDPQQLFLDLADSGSDDAIDMVILGTCELDLQHWHEKLLNAWELRDNERKFELVCIVHHAENRLFEVNIHEWSRRNALRVLTISKHVQRTLHQIFQTKASDHSPLIASSGLEYVPVNVHIPILNVSIERQQSPPLLSNAVIQGSLSVGRRDYLTIFDDLVKSLHEDPKAWGYLPLANHSSFLPDPDLSDQPFRLHLAGSGSLNVPPELKNVIVFHTNLNYFQYYDLMTTMDICIPAFPNNKKYFEDTASSTAAMCLESDVPLLVTQRIREAYAHLDDDRVIVTRPAAMGEVAAIRALRTNNISTFLASDPAQSGVSLGSHPRLRGAAERMLSAGWHRTKGGFDAVKRLIWDQNEAVVIQLIFDT